MKMRRSDTARAWGIVCSHQLIPKINNLDQSNADLGDIGGLENCGCRLLHDQDLLL
jgi:hypothetical protein